MSIADGRDSIGAMVSRPAVLVVIGFALASPAATAKTVMLGSSLAAPATVTQAHRADTVFWSTAIAGRGIAAPRDGQVVLVRLKGTVVPSTQAGAPPPRMAFTTLHIQTLRPGSGSALRIQFTSAAFFPPVGGDASQITEFRPENLCVKRGDFVALNAAGGLDPPSYPDGTPLRIFAAVPNSTTASYEKGGATNNGDTVRPTRAAGQELLLQYAVASGRDATPLCGGTQGQAPHPGRMTIPAQRAYVRANRVARPVAFCPAGTGGCRGRATLTVKGGALAPTKRFTTPAGSVHIRMRLTRRAYRALLRRPGRVRRARFAVRTSAGRVARTITIRH